MLEALERIVGQNGLIADRVELEPWLTDWRGRRRGRALCMVSPNSTAEVSAVAALCAAERQPIFSIGGNTGLCYGAVPESADHDRPGILLSLRRMNRVRSLDRASNIATVEAGIVLGDLHAAAERVDRQFPLRLGSEGSAQIGGLISTNAGGTGVVRYGPTRDLVAGLEVVLADGRVLNDLVALKKDNTGYLLRELFIGAEGTLGIVTAAAVKLFPKTPNSAHAWVAVPSPAAAVDLLASFQDGAGPYIEAFELLSASQIRLVQRHIERSRIPFADTPEWSVMIELAAVDPGTALGEMLETLLGSGLASGTVSDAAIASSTQQAATFWHIRHSVSEANKKEGVGIVHDIALRTSDVPAFIERAEALAAERFPQAVTQVVSHLGDGNVHYILMFPHSYWAAMPNDEDFALEVERALHDVAAALGGTFSAEHGIGRKLTEELHRLADPVRYELMGRIKQTIDPMNLMNPGVLFGANAGRKFVA